MKPDSFQAISDPTRRKIIELLMSGETSLKLLGNHFSMSRQALSKHVQILANSKLITIQKRGRENFCEIYPDSFAVIEEWLELVRKYPSSK